MQGIRSKKYILCGLAVCLLLCGCGVTESDTSKEITASVIQKDSSQDIVEDILVDLVGVPVEEDCFDVTDEVSSVSEMVETTEAFSHAADTSDFADVSSEDNLVPTEEEPQVYEPLTIGVVGDIYISSKIYNTFTEEGVSGFLQDGLEEHFLNADLMLANHEYAATDLGDSEKDTRQRYNYKAPTAYEDIWNAMGVDCVSLANNHAKDYGEQSLKDTVETLDDLDIAHVGAGMNLEEAKKPYITEINGKKIGILSACRFVVSEDWYATEDSSGVLTTYESTKYYGIVKDEITRLKEEEQCDFVLMYVHFGVEHTDVLEPFQEKVAHGYIDAGADAVIGSHAHCLQGIEIYQGKPIYYNLGNFLFENYASDTVIVELTVNEDNTCNTKIIPCKAVNSVVTKMDDKKASILFRYLESISINISIDEEGNVTEK